MRYFNILPLLIGEIKIETSKYLEDLNRTLSYLPFSFRMKTNLCHGTQLFGLTPLLPFWLHFMRLPPSFSVSTPGLLTLCKYEECFHAGGPSVKNNFSKFTSFLCSDITLSVTKLFTMQGTTFLALFTADIPYSSFFFSLALTSF